MMRAVPEWIAKHDDQPIPTSVKRRIVERQDGRSALSQRPFGPTYPPEYDHKVALWLGGEHRESNIQAIGRDEHAAKTKAEASVRAKSNRQMEKNLGIQTKSKVKIPTKLKDPKVSSKPLPPRRAIYALAPVQERNL